ncbi:amiloride-sensitive sodium channel subunit alpha [Nephila pilipes]|uniref:Amiloride-sensitive sodium channel subunit alpha n=1 Tax=Nephila pilipes TaxID=299642 RepID=A0A8X6QL95_NEPPI|nr:amiloride-sensitive sodium channel subunit alpha [Nephila pilipes]
MVTTKIHTESVQDLFLTFCFTGFFYQSFTFLSHIFQYPTIVDIRIENPQQIEMPALTFCDNNGVNRKKFCSKFPDRCMEADPDLCFKYPSYCEFNATTMVPQPEYYSLINELTVENVSEFGHSVEELLINRESLLQNNLLDIQPEGPFVRAKHFTGKGRMGCYSLYSVADSPQGAEMQQISGLIEVPAVILTFDVNEEEEFIPGRKTGMYLSVHSPYMGNNPTEKGIFMEPGKTYRIYVNTDREMLLPYPYETDCLNYTALWESRNRTGPRIQEMCKHKCLLDATAKYDNCSFIFTLFPNDLEICDLEKASDDFLEDYNTCKDLCKDDCAKTKYNLNVQERFTRDFIFDDQPSENQTKLIKVEIIIEKSEVITFLHRPQYLSVEAFSYIGGFIGVWLGISLVEVADFADSMFRIIRYAFKKKDT